MATAGTKLVLTLKDSDYQNMTMSYNYADPEVSTASVQALCSGLVTNGSIFDKVPVAATKAEVVQTAVRVVQVND